MRCFTFNHSLLHSVGKKYLKDEDLRKGAALQVDVTLFLDAFTGRSNTRLGLSDTREDFFGLGASGGVAIQFHSNRHFPHTPDFLTPSVGHNTQFQVQFYQHNTISKENSRCVDQNFYDDSYVDYVDFRKFRDTNNDVTSYSKTQKACEDRKIAETIAEKCGCNAFEFPIEAEIYNKYRHHLCYRLPQNMSYSSFDGCWEEPTNKNQFLRCGKYFKAINRIYKNHNCVTNILMRKDKIRGQCVRSCQEKKYVTRTNTEIWPERYNPLFLKGYLFHTKDVWRSINSRKFPGLYHAYHQENLPPRERDYRLVTENVLRLSISPLPSSPAYAVEEQRAYPLINLLSDIGGSLGLWIGTSVLTLCEVSELCLTLFVSMLCGKKPKQKRKNSMKIINKQIIHVVEHSKSVCELDAEDTT